MKPLFSPTPVKYSFPTAQAVAMNTTTANVPCIATSNVVANLNTAEQQAVRTLRQQLANKDPLALVNYGGNVQTEMAKLADAVLEHTKSSDVEFVGSKMTEIIIKAKGINTSNLSQSKSSVPIIGKLIDTFRNNKERVLAQFNTISEQVEKIVVEVDVFNNGLSTRLKMLEDLYQANIRQYRELDLHIIAAKMEKEQLSAELEQFKSKLGSNPDPFDVQQVDDATRYLANLDITICNMERIQMSAVQAAPQIRVMQQNGVQLIGKFNQIKKDAVPMWKKNFALALTIEEQRKGAEFANALDEFTNQQARDNATQLQQTSVAIAKSNQRGVVDLETLEFVQSKLIATIEEGIKIATEGATARQNTTKRIGEMKVELQSKLTA